MHDLLPVLWPDHEEYVRKDEGNLFEGGNILSKTTYRKIRDRLSEVDSLCEFEISEHLFFSMQ